MGIRILGVFMAAAALVSVTSTGAGAGVIDDTLGGVPVLEDNTVTPPGGADASGVVSVPRLDGLGTGR